MAEVTHLWWGKPLQTPSKAKKNNTKGFRNQLPACHILKNPLPFRMELPFEKNQQQLSFFLVLKMVAALFGQPLVLQIPCEKVLFLGAKTTAASGGVSITHAGRGLLGDFCL